MLPLASAASRSGGMNCRVELAQTESYLPATRCQPSCSNLANASIAFGRSKKISVFRYETRRFYSVTYHGAKGRTRVRTFSWRDPKGELAAYAAAIKFRRKKTKFR